MSRQHNIQPMLAAADKSMSQFRQDDIAVITFNDVPPVNLTFKYEVLGRMAIENRHRYCERHGYRFICEVPIARDRPACWAKIPALLAALEAHPWVLWADSDTLVFAQERRIDSMCDPDYDLIVQSHEEFFRFIGIPVAAPTPLHGVQFGKGTSTMFLVRA